MKIDLIAFLFLLISFSACKSKMDALSKTTPNISASNECSCYNGIGSSEADKPIFSSSFSNGSSVSLCGYLNEDMQKGSQIISEFNVFDCKTGTALVEYGALQTCRVIKKENSIVIEELSYLPAGENWEWMLIQIGKQTLLPKGEGIYVQPQIPKLEKIKINKTKQSKFLNSLQKGNGFGEEWESDIGKLEVLSLIGNDRAWEILKNYQEFTGELTDGALAEQWKNAIATVEWIKGI